MQQDVSTRRRRLYQTALAAPVFSSGDGGKWALLPRGMEAPIPVRIGSDKYREWLCQRAEEKAGITPSVRQIGEAVRARQRDASYESGEAAMRIHRLRDGSIFLHLGGEESDCLRVWTEGWDISPPPCHIHFRYPEKHLPLPQPIHTDSTLTALLASAFGPSQGATLSKWLINVLNQKGPAETLLFTGARRLHAARSLLDLLDPRDPVSRTPSFEDDWVLFNAEFSQLTPAQLEKLNYYAGIRRRPVILTAPGRFAGLENFMEIDVPEFEPFDSSEVLGALATAVQATVRVRRKASSSLVRLRSEGTKNVLSV